MHDWCCRLIHFKCLGNINRHSCTNHTHQDVFCRCSKPCSFGTFNDIPADWRLLPLLPLLFLLRGNRPAAEPSQGSHRSRSRPAEVREAGQAPLRARAGAVLGDPQEEHPEIQQLHLPHRVTGRPLRAPPAGVGSISIRVLVRGWEEVRMRGKGHGFYIHNDRALITFFLFAHFFFFFLWSCALWLDLCRPVALCQKHHAGV